MLRARRRPDRRPAGLRSPPGGLAVFAVVAVVGFVLFAWVLAAFFAVLRIVQLVAVAVIAGWVGLRLGIRQGRRGAGGP